MANGYQGEIDIELHGINYTMRVDMGAIAEFQSETGADFMHVSMKALNAFYKSRELPGVLDRAEVMTGAVSMEHAAYLFWICAKRVNSAVEFAEFQEAVLMEGPLEAGTMDTYPFKFVQLVEFATCGIQDRIKKKTLEQSKI